MHGETTSSLQCAYRLPAKKKRSQLRALTVFLCTVCLYCAWPISTNSGPTGADEFKLTRKTCFILIRFEFVSIAGTSWFWCTCGGISFLFPNAHDQLHVHGILALVTTLLVMRVSNFDRAKKKRPLLLPEAFDDHQRAQVDHRRQLLTLCCVSS